MSGLDLVPPAPGCGLRPFQEEALERVPTSLAGDRRPLLALPTSAGRALRPFQKEALERLRRSFLGGHRRPVLALPTGAGKTVIAAEIATGALAKGNRVMFCVPALELIEQTIESFRQQGITDLGVIQAAHPMTNYAAPVQIASVQTLARRILPPVELVIVDEAHIYSKAIASWMDRDPKLIFVGLSATPWAKGMGRRYDDLIVCATIQELIDAGYLSPFRCYAPAEPDLSGVRTNKGDFVAADLSATMSESGLVADVVSTWLEKGEARPTLCFAVDCAHAQSLQARFAAAGVTCGYVDAYTDNVERALTRRRFEAGELRVVCNVGCLTTGVDWAVGCIILARPTRSEMLYVQMVGRGLRVNPGLDDCIILDHAGNALRLGLVTDIHHTSLDSGNRKAAAVPQRSEPLPKKCPQCSFVKPAKVRLCPQCGFEAQPVSDVQSIDGELFEITGRKRKYTTEEKQAFYSGLLWIEQEMGRKSGWAAHVYRDKFDVWPNKLERTLCEPSAEVRAWVKSRDIRFAKARSARHAA